MKSHHSHRTLPLHPKAKGLSPAAAPDAVREGMEKDHRIPQLSNLSILSVKFHLILLKCLYISIHSKCIG
jgi:hypothetical protein